MTAALPLAVALACGGDTRDATFANVDKKETKEDPDEAKRLEERKQKRLADEKAKAEQQAARTAEIAKIAVVPPKLPKDLEKGCQAVAEAQDRFMQRHHGGDELAKWTAAKEEELPMTVVQCASANSLEVAGCQAHALDNAPALLKDGTKEILDACIAKFAKAMPSGPGPGVAGPAAIPKRPR
jgi:hypothetical protein